MKLFFSQQSINLHSFAFSKRLHYNEKVPYFPPLISLLFLVIQISARGNGRTHTTHSTSFKRSKDTIGRVHKRTTQTVSYIYFSFIFFEQFNKDIYLLCVFFSPPPLFLSPLFSLSCYLLFPLFITGIDSRKNGKNSKKLAKRKKEALVTQ